ncbi:MAG: hypothetical protein GTN93_33980 [Anaerolineae bacterium]|nr:hypothetical protein [Anaerolineae bacterium]
MSFVLKKLKEEKKKSEGNGNPFGGQKQKPVDAPESGDTLDMLDAALNDIDKDKVTESILNKIREDAFAEMDAEIERNRQKKEQQKKKKRTSCCFGSCCF